MTRIVHYLAGSEPYQGRARLLMLCGNAAMRMVGEDGFTLSWEAVTCRDCLSAKAP